MNLNGNTPYPGNTNPAGMNGGIPSAGVMPAAGGMQPAVGYGAFQAPPQAPPPPGYGRAAPQAPGRYPAQPGNIPANRPPEILPDEGGQDAPPKKKKKTSRDYAISLLIKLGVTAAVITLLLTVFAGVYVCHNTSSYPMIKDGDLCLTSRLATLRQGDMIAYRDGGTIKFGRVLAFEGDTVEIMNDFVAVNGYGVYEETVYPTTPEGASIEFPYTVPDGCVFVLNDHRSDISDSRTLGGVPEKDVKGKVFMIMRRRGI